MQATLEESATVTSDGNVSLTVDVAGVVTPTAKTIVYEAWLEMN